jgi:L-amino acid N-acyltransferase YncA
MKLQGSGTSAPKTLQFQTRPHSQIATHNQLLRRCSRTTNYVGTLRSVGFKHGKWLDTVLMQRTLGKGDTTMP